MTENMSNYFHRLMINDFLLINSYSGKKSSRNQISDLPLPLPSQLVEYDKIVDIKEVFYIKKGYSDKKNNMNRKSALNIYYHIGKKITEILTLTMVEEICYSY